MLTACADRLGTVRTGNQALESSDAPLAREYDVALLDLDGVVYLGPDAVPHAPDALESAREAGMRLAFVTNNAARTPAAVARHLSELGISAEPDEVVTSAQAAAHVLADRLPSGARVLVLGDDGLFEALRERGLEPVLSAEDAPAAVVQGYSPTLGWRQLAEGAVAINRGLPWVATNLDRTVPSARGPLPGNGSMVAALQHATGHDPDIATGKPDPTMHLESVERTGAKRPLIVGDRLDTDIEGAVRAECASLLVFTGVTTAADLLAAPESRRPTYLGLDLRALLREQPVVERSGERTRCGRWVAERTDDDGISVGLDPAAGQGLDDSGLDDSVGEAAHSHEDGPGDDHDDTNTDVITVGGEQVSDDDLDALRALAGCAWSAPDQARLTARDRAGAAVLTRWGLTAG